MQHFRAEGGHFRRFFKRDHINTFRRGNNARVGGVNARNVSPDIDARSMQGLAQQRGGVVAAATAKRGGAAFRFAADKALGDHDTVCQAGSQLLIGQLRQRFNVRLGAAKAVAGTHDFAYVKPLRLNVTLAHDFHKQQGGHQLTVADQLIGQGGGGGQRRCFCQGGDIFQQAFHFFADHVWILQTLKDVELNFAQCIQLHETFCRFQSFRQRNQQVRHAGGCRQHHQAGIRIGQHHIGAAVHGIVIGHTGAAKLGDHKTRHNNLVSGNE